MNNSGYLHSLYAESLMDIGGPIELSASKGWILKRPVLETVAFDGMGCYPIFACQDWSVLEQDLDWLSDQLVCLSLVTDPFGQYNQSDLSRSFKDIARPYKEHFVVDLEQNPESFVAAHHQRNANKSLKNVNIEICPDPIQYLDDWISLYKNLIERHHIAGIARFSRDSFVKQLSVPGLVAFRADRDGETLGMLLWYIHGNVGYYHLGAYSSNGYKLNTSFALFWTALGYFAKAGLQWLSLGAGAGTNADENDGLSRFKRGWSTGVKTAYFCGRIFNPKKYQEIIQVKQIPPTRFFPAYRLGEF